MQTNEPINTIPIQAFIQQVKSADASNQREIKLPMTQAKQLAFALGIVMSNQEGRLEKLVKESKGASDEVIQVQLGGSNWD